MHSSNSQNSGINHLLNAQLYGGGGLVGGRSDQQPTDPSKQASRRSTCQNCKDYKLGETSFSLCNECDDGEPAPADDQPCNQPTDKLKLMELAAKVVALHYPFQSIEERYERIPEPVQRRIIYWSFPQNEDDICMYSSLNFSDDKKYPFKTGIHLVETKCVNNVLQVGFHLSGTVNGCNVKSSSYHLYQSGNDSEKKYRVSITFDRCKITSVTCSCDTKDIFWCAHVVALAVYRIRYPSKIKLRVPISETLLQLDKCQLQKLVQFLISEHHTEVLPTAQSLADKMLNRNSILNAIGGAPDPTAGAATEQENCWHLDEQQVTKQVTNSLASDHYMVMNRHINALFGKVKEMLKARDSNASRMLRLITEQFLNNQRLISWRSQGNMSDKFRQLWDQLVALWVYIALNPHATASERKKIGDYLHNWTLVPNCPLEDANYRLGSSQLRRKLDSSDEEEEANRSGDELMNEDPPVGKLVDDNNNYASNYNERKRPSPQSLIKIGKRGKRRRGSPRTIFHRALEASRLNWDHPHLRMIIDEEKVDQKNGRSTTVYPPVKLKTNGSYADQLPNLKFNSKNQPLWNESIPTACARVEALRCHGYQKAALKLAVSIVRSLKKQQQLQLESIKKQQELMNIQNQSDLLNSGVNRHSAYCNQDGLIGNPLDSISTLFDTLAEASLTPDSKPLEHYYGMFLGDFNNKTNSNYMAGNLPPSTPLELNIPQLLDYQDPFYAFNHHHQRGAGSQYNREKPKYIPIPVEGSVDRNESYISLALEAALIGLGQQRLMPSGEYLQEKSLKQEERLIAKLIDLEFNHNLYPVLRKQAINLLDGGPYSGLGLGIHPESVPMHTFARFLFTALLTYDVDLAYQVGLRAMRLPILEGFNNFFEDLNNNSLLQNNNHRLNGGGHHFPGLYLQNAANNYMYPFLNNYHHHQQQLQNQINRSHDHHYRSGNRHGQGIGQHGSNSSWHRWHVLNTIEQQQTLLATTMIYAAKNDLSRLKDVQKAAQKHIHTSAYLFLLAQETFKIAVPTESGSGNTSGANNSANSNTTNGGSSSSSINNHHHHLHGNHHSHPNPQLSYLHQRLNGNGGALNPAYNPFLSNLSSLGFPTTPGFPLTPHNAGSLAAAYGGHSFKPNTVSHLLEVAFELGLQVVKMTMNHTDSKRKEIVKWIVNCAQEMGFVGLCYLMQFWENLFSAIEAVGPVASFVMNASMLNKQNNLTGREQDSLWAAAKELAVKCTKTDPLNCSLLALSLCENDSNMFRSCYELVVEAGSARKMPFNHLIQVARYMESKNYPEWAFKLSQLAIKTITINYNQEQSPMVNEIHWICSLAHSLGKEQLSKLVPILIDNISCAQLLSDILRRCTSSGTLGYPLHNTGSANNVNQQPAPAPPNHHASAGQFSANYPYLGLNGNSFALNGTNHHHQYSHSRRHHSLGHGHSKHLAVDKDPLKALLDAAIQAYIKSTHLKLQVISPRHYSDFVEFLAKAKETFLLASDGECKFNQLIESIRTSYKGKKKLLNNILSKFQQGS